MRIKNIRIKNFKILKDITIKNLLAVAVFLGANGSGKFLGDLQAVEKAYNVGGLSRKQ